MAFPCLRIPPSKESCAPPDGNPKTQEIRHPHPAFLQNRLLAQVKSQRSINRFRILHGRQVIFSGYHFWAASEKPIAPCVEASLLFGPGATLAAPQKHHGGDRVALSNYQPAGNASARAAG